MFLILCVSSVAMYLLEPVGCRIDPKGPSNIYIYRIYIYISHIYIYIFETTKTYCKLVLGPYVWNLRQILILTQPIRIRREVAIVDPHICWNAGILQPAMLNYPLKQVDQSVFCSNKFLVNGSPQQISGLKLSFFLQLLAGKVMEFGPPNKRPVGKSDRLTNRASVLPCNKIDNWRESRDLKPPVEYERMASLKKHWRSKPFYNHLQYL